MTLIDTVQGIAPWVKCRLLLSVSNQAQKEYGGRSANETTLCKDLSLETVKAMR
jgi:hypothetical protein